MLEMLNHRLAWYVAGPLVGLVTVMLLWVANQPLGALGGYIELEEWTLGRRRAASWRTFFFLGMVASGILFSLASSGWHPTTAYGSFDHRFAWWPPLKLCTLTGAGTLIGFGGRMAGGCTSGHGVCGTAVGSPASFASTATFMGTAVAATWALSWVFGA